MIWRNLRCLEVVIYRHSTKFCVKEMKEKSVTFCILKDTHREKAPSNKTPALTKSTKMGIWVVGAANQLSIRGS